VKTLFAFAKPRTLSWAPPGSGPMTWNEVLPISIATIAISGMTLLDRPDIPASGHVAPQQEAR
jgi:hypothetical protein